MHFFNFHCQHSYYAYYKKLLKCHGVLTSRKYFLLKAAAGPSCCNIYIYIYIQTGGCAGSPLLTVDIQPLAQT